MRFFSSLNREQKETVGIIQVGTFLEYFDLMLYVHMAVFLNEIFFPPADAHTSELLVAFGFCSSYILRPVGALLFGWFGDTFGRKHTVLLTTILMFTSCVIMANVRTYAEIGITAAWIVTICRILQGFSSMGEVIGAEIYLTESLKPPLQYICVSFLGVSCVLGGLIALLAAYACTAFGFSWRNCFVLGACIVGSVVLIRLRLRETLEYANMKQRMLIARSKHKQKDLHKIKKIFEKEEGLGTLQDHRRTALMHFLLLCNGPLFFYFIYIYCGGLLKTSFQFTPEQIVYQHLIVAFVSLFAITLVSVLSYKIYPLTILKWKCILSAIFIAICPFWLQNINNSFELLIFQCIGIASMATSEPAVPIFLKNYPVLKRFTYATWTFAAARTLMAVLPAFGLIYLTAWFGYWGLWIIFIPTITAFAFSLGYFEKLEQKKY